MEHLLCDQPAIIRAWGTVFARYGFAVDLVENIEEQYQVGEHAGHLTYWGHDLHEGRPQAILLEIGDWGMSLIGDAASRHLDLLNLETFLLQRTVPWVEPTDPLHEILRAARLLPMCAASYTRIDRAAVYHAWTHRLADLAPALFNDPGETQAVAMLFEAAADRLAGRYLALATRGLPSETILAGAGLDFAASADVALWHPPAPEDGEEGQQRTETAGPATGTPAPSAHERSSSEDDAAIPEADRDLIAHAGTTAKALFAWVNVLIVSPALHWRAQPLPADLRAFLDGHAVEERVEALAGRIASAAWRCGGVAFAGRHWCTVHGHRAAPLGPGLPTGEREVTIRTSWRPTAEAPAGLACVTVHHPCCPRTLSGGQRNGAFFPEGEFAAWAKKNADMAQAGATGNADAEGLGMVCTCLNEPDPAAPVDIVYVFGDDLAGAYLDLLRRLGFEVRVTAEAAEVTCDPADPIPATSGATRSICGCCTPIDPPRSCDSTSTVTSTASARSTPTPATPSAPKSKSSGADIRTEVCGTGPPVPRGRGETRPRCAAPRTPV
jgi:hypothetical protein